MRSSTQSQWFRWRINARFGRLMAVVALMACTSEAPPTADAGGPNDVGLVAPDLGVDSDAGAVPSDSGAGPEDLGPLRRPTIVEPSGAAGAGASEHYRAKVVVAPLSPVGAGRSTNFRALVGTRGGQR